MIDNRQSDKNKQPIWQNRTGGSTDRNRPHHSQLHINRKPRYTPRQDGGVKVKITRAKKPNQIYGVSDEKIRVIPLGGVEEIGKNMTIVEYKNDIVIIDMGFEFPGEEAPGVDYIIPDITYLIARKHKIKGVFITHGHLDHTGGIPYIMQRIGNPTIYTRELTSLIIKKRHEEFPHLPKLDIKIVEKGGAMKIGDNLSVNFFNVTHTIPDAMGISIVTPHGEIVFTGDVKVDHNKGVPLEHEVETYSELAKRNILLLCADSTNVERDGWSFSEREVHENLKKIVAAVKGRLIMGTFSSLLERIIFLIHESEKIGKKVLIRGRSMKTNVAIATEIGMVKVGKNTLIPPEDLQNHPPEKIVILATGAQGDKYAALMRMSTGKDKYIQLTKDDTVLLSSSIIPGNEVAVQLLKDNLSRRGVKIIHYRTAEVHSSGHAYHDELVWIHKIIKPKFFMPLHGHHHMLTVHREIAEEAGMKRENVVIPDNGSIIEITDNGSKISIVKEKASANVVMVDGLGNGDVKDVVIRDRQALAQDGMFVVIAAIDMQNGKVRQSPDIISRGFIYLKESQSLLREARILATKTIEKTSSQMHPINLSYVKNEVREKIGKFLMKKTGKRPIVLPVMIEV